MRLVEFSMPVLILVSLFVFLILLNIYYRSVPAWKRQAPTLPAGCDQCKNMILA